MMPCYIYIEKAEDDVIYDGGGVCVLLLLLFIYIIIAHRGIYMVFPCVYIYHS